MPRSTTGMSAKPLQLLLRANGSISVSDLQLGGRLTVSTTALRPHRGNFTLGFAVLVTATVFFGFSIAIVPRVIQQLRPAVLYVHVVTAAAWMLLLIAQAALARNGKIALHRRLGVYGLWLGAIAAVTSFATALVLRHDSVISHGADQTIKRIAFLSIPLNGFVAFSVALGLAALWRTRPAYHRRCMMLAAVALLGPGLARIPLLAAIPGGIDTVQVTTLAVLCAHDLWTERRLHRVYLAGAPLMIALGVASIYLYLAHPAWWVATARWMILV
jgi:uncharacterized membrane protein YozB (DUF420 family)